MHLVKPPFDPILTAASAAYDLMVRRGLSPSESEKALRAAVMVAEERNTLSARNSFNSQQALAQIERLQEKYGDSWGDHLFDPE
jgi:hypothetical protein